MKISLATNFDDNLIETEIRQAAVNTTINESNVEKDKYLSNT